MKKAKRLLALTLGVLMVMGCLSVSAANSVLEVAEKPAKAIYYEDFSGATLDTTHITTGASVVLENGALVAKNPAKNEEVFSINMVPEGIKEPVFLEFELSHLGLKDVRDAQIIYTVKSTKGDFIQHRWYNASTPYIRTMGSWSQDADSYKPYKDINCAGSTAKVKMKLNPLTGAFTVWVNDDLFIAEGETGLRGEEQRPYLYSTGNFTDIKNITFKPTEAGIREIKIDNIKLYPAGSVATPAIPVAGEEIYRHTFDGDTVDTNMVEVVDDHTLTLSQANGILSLSGGHAQAARIYLQSNKQALTGKYVVETTYKTFSHTSTSGGYHRLTYGSVGTHYFQWYGSKVLKFRLGNDKLGDSGYYDFTTQADTYNALGDTVKVTQYFDTDAMTITAWINDVYAYTQEYTASESNVYSIPYLYTNVYNGTVNISDIRVYRPATFDAETGLSITEDEDTLEIATNAAKDGRLYFATYTGSGDATSLNNLGTAALSLEPGKVYTISKADWAGAKAFFWDNDQKPIVDSWNLR